MGLKQILQMILEKGNNLTLEQCTKLHNIGFNIVWSNGELSSIHYAE